MTRNRNMKLELADNQITRCEYCGDWTMNTTLCRHCQTNSYPVINDFQRMTA